jgi:hypothetical protein
LKKVFILLTYSIYHRGWAAVQERELEGDCNCLPCGLNDDFEIDHRGQIDVPLEENQIMYMITALKGI